MKIGARILKTGAAVGLALYVCQIFGLEPIILAGIAAAISVQPSLYRSWQNSVQQVQANIVGAIVAILLAFLLGTQPYMIALGVIIVISINIQLNFLKSIPLAIVTVLAIMGSPSEHFWEMAGDRFLLLFIGVISSIVINLFVPPRYEQRLSDQMFEIQDKIALNLRMIVDTDRERHQIKQELEQMSEALTELEEIYSLHREGNRYKLRNLIPRTRKLVVLRNLVQTCRDGLQTLYTLEKHKKALELNDAARELVWAELQKIASMQEKVFLKFAGKIKPHLVNDEPINHDEPILTVRETMHHCKNDEDLMIHLLPAILTINDYRHQLEKVDRIVEHYIQFAVNKENEHV